MITKNLLDSITSRSNMLSRRYYFLEKEDLMQEGYILLLELEEKRLTDLQKHKAINNMYANLERHAQYQQKIEKNISSFEINPDYVDDLEDIVEKDEITQKLLDKLSRQELVIVEWLAGGLNLDQIATILRVGRDRVRRIIVDIIRKRREEEDVSITS